MTDDEIRDTYEELSEDEAFEAFNSDSTDPDQIERVLGEGVMRSYSLWTYLHIK